MTDTDARTQTHHDTGEIREHGTAACSTSLAHWSELNSMGRVVLHASISLDGYSVGDHESGLGDVDTSAQLDVRR